MHRMVVAVGNSKGASIPVEILNKLDLAAGSDVNPGASAFPVACRRGSERLA